MKKLAKAIIIALAIATLMVAEYHYIMTHMHLQYVETGVHKAEVHAFVFGQMHTYEDVELER